MIGSAVYSELASDSSITNLVGTRIYPNNVRQYEPFPQLVFELKNDDHVQSMAGDSALASVDLTITCVSASYKATDVLAQAVVSLINNFSGTWIGGTGVPIKGCFLTTQEDDTVRSTDSEAIVYYIKEQTYQVWYQTR